MSPPGHPLDICPFEQMELVRDALRVKAGFEEDNSPFVESVLSYNEGYSFLAAMLESARVRLDATLRRLKCGPGDLVRDHEDVDTNEDAS